MLSFLNCMKSKDDRKQNTKVQTIIPRNHQSESFSKASKSSMETWRGTAHENSVNSLNHINTTDKPKQG